MPQEIIFVGQLRISTYRGNWTYRIQVLDRTFDGPARELQKHDVLLLDADERGIDDPDIKVGELKDGMLEFSALRSTFYFVAIRNDDGYFHNLIQKLKKASAD